MMGRALAGLILSVTPLVGWEKYQTPPGGDAVAFAFSGARKFALTWGGLYFRDPGQSAWTLVDLPASKSVDNLKAFGNVVLAEDWNGVSSLSKDGGKTWQPLDLRKLDEKPLVGSVLHLGKHGLFVSADHESLGMFHSSDTGRTWRRLLPGVDVQNLVDAGPDLAFSVPESGVFRLDPANWRRTPISAGLLLNPDMTYMLWGNGSGTLFASSGHHPTPLYRYVRASNRWVEALPDFGEDWPRFAMEGAKVFMAVYHGGDTITLSRSTDNGVTWQHQRDFNRWPGGLWSQGDTLYFNDPFLSRREWASKATTRWDQGIRAYLPDWTWLHGKTLYLESWLGGRLRTRNRGADWEVVKGRSDSVPESVHLTGNQVYLSGTKSLDRLDPAGPGRQSLPYLPVEMPIGRFIDAADRFYAVSYLAVSAFRYQPVLYAAPKERFIWGRAQVLPFAYLSDLDAFGATLVATCRDTVAVSKDGGLTWERLENTTFKRLGNGPSIDIGRVSGRWMAFDWDAFHEADDDNPFGIWSRIDFPVDTLRHYAMSDSRLLVYDAHAAHISADRGRTWKRHALPHPFEEITTTAFSDSMLCVARNTEHQCLELEPLPTGAAPKWTRVGPALPSLQRRAGGMAFRDPRRVGIPWRGLDGRALDQAPLRR